ncbi:MAG: P-loop NTPase [Coriobacteriales bacterium]|jgi:pilus assembly protein CpaE|nr:P-loop NTPase [Coriobacteriales bacterium]
MNEAAVAYAFPALSDDQGRHGGLVTVFSSSEYCRAALGDEPPSLSVIVGAGSGSVTPINLAAALCADAPERDVYLVEDAATESLAARARAAGIRGILNSSQATHLLGEPLCTLPAAPIKDHALPSIGSALAPLVPCAPSIPPAMPAVAPLPSRATAFEAPSLSYGGQRPFARQGRVLGFFSGRGGVGKSTVSLMAAFAAQQTGARVALVDLDLQFGDLGYLAGRESNACVQRLPLTRVCAGLELPTLEDEALVLLCAPEQPEEGEHLTEAIPRLLEWLASERDLVVLNTGSFWMDVHVVAMRHCDHLVFLMDQRATSVEACKQAIDLSLRMQMPQVRFHYVLNGCGRHAALMPQDVGLALGGVEVYGLADGGSLVDELLALGCPLELLNSGNAFVASLEGFLNGMIGQRPLPAEMGRPGRSERTRQPRENRAKVFDLSALRAFFEGAHRVAT